jgi:hypothetical protein
MVAAVVVVNVDTVVEVVAEAAVVVAEVATASSAASLVTGLASAPLVGVTVVVVAATPAATATTVGAIDMAEVTATAVAEGEVVTAEAAAAIVTGIVQEAQIGRTEVRMPEKAVQTTAVTGTVAAAVTVMQVATDMPVLEEAVLHVTRQAAPGTDPDLMTGPVGDPVVTMIVIDETRGQLLTRPVEMVEDTEENGGPSVFGST